MLPSSLVDLRARPRAAAVLGLALVLVVAALFFGARVLLARHAAAPQPVAAVTPGDGEPDPGSDVGPRRATPSAVPSRASVLLVHVVGQVRDPGVVRLHPGDRLKDAVAAAGGATRHADLGAVNLARPVADGEQVRVPKPGERVEAPAGTGAGGPAGGTGTSGPGAVTAPGEEAPVDLNSATQEQLESLPGIGPVMAQRILQWRAAHGRFSSVEELLEVSGIGDKTFADLSPRVTV